MKRIKAMLMVAAVMVMVMSLFAAPASAAGQGEIVFSGTASLPNFPAATPTTGTFSGSASGKVVGTYDNGTPYALVFTQQSMNATFTYNEPIATCPAVGSASTPGSQGWTITGSSTGTSTSFTISGDFNWERVGATAVITITNVTVSTSQGIDAGGSGAATAAFESPNAVTNCLAGGGPLTATVAGSGTVAGA